MLYDCENGEVQTYYEASWLDIINDQYDVRKWFYKEAPLLLTSDFQSLI